MQGWGVSDVDAFESPMLLELNTINSSVYCDFSGIVIWFVVSFLSVVCRCLSTSSQD